MTAPGRVTGTVRLDGSRLLLNVAVTDAAVVAHARAAAQQRPDDDLGDWLASVLLAGSTAVAVAGTATDLLQAEQALLRTATTVDSSVQAALERLQATITTVTDPQTGPLHTASQDAVTRLSQGIGAIMADGGLVPTRITATVTQAGQASVTQVQQALATQTAALAKAVQADRDALIAGVTAANADAVREITAAVTELRQAVTVAKAVTDAVAEASRHSPSDGLAYEDLVADAVGRIAAAAGDTGADAVGTLTGDDGASRRGDATVTWGDAARLVVEAKDRHDRMGPTAWARELQAARTNRSATAGLGVVPSPDQMPVRGEHLIMLGSGCDLVVVYDPDAADDTALRVAYHVLRAARPKTTGDDIDIVRVQAAVTEVRDLLTDVDRLRRHAGGLNRTAAAITTDVAALRERLLARCDRLKSVVNGTSPSSDDAPASEIADAGLLAVTGTNSPPLPAAS